MCPNPALKKMLINLKDNAQNTFRHATMNFSLANRTEPTWARSHHDAVARNSDYTPASYGTSSMRIWDTDMAVDSSVAEIDQSSNILNQLQTQNSTASSPFRLNEALPSGNHAGLGQHANQERINDLPQPGFFSVLNAFQGALHPPGYTDTTQAISIDSMESSGQLWDAMQNTDSPINAQINQITTQVEGTQHAGGNTGVDGYYNVHQAVQPWSLSGFTDANLAMQGIWDA